MRELVGRLDALDPDASAAVQVIAYFDQLSQARAGLQSIVRGAAVLAGCAAGLADDERRVRLRVGPDGHRREPADTRDPTWLSAPVAPGDTAVLWLERPGPAGPVEAMVLERAAAAAYAVLDRTRGKALAPGHDEAAIEVLIDENAPEDARRHAASALNLAEGDLVHAIALETGARIGRQGDRIEPATRAGIGPDVRVLDLPGSWAAARTALRLTAEGTEDDPGPRIVRADDLGGLALLAAVVGLAAEPVPDVLALEQAASAAPWMLSTLDAVATSMTLRTAAAALGVHHSTLQDRVTHAERVLGWPIREPRGRFRLYAALMLRRLYRNRR